MWKNYQSINIFFFLHDIAEAKKFSLRTNTSTSSPSPFPWPNLLLPPRPTLSPAFNLHASRIPVHYLPDAPNHITHHHHYPTHTSSHFFSNLRMEVADLVSHTKKISCEESRLELPPSQDPTLSPDLNLIGKLITSKDTGLKYVKDIALRAWKPVYSMEVKRLDKNIFMFSFQHEVDAHRAFLSRPWSCRGGHLILKRWSLDITWQEVNFSTSTFWVQVHGLPTLWRIENNLIKIEGRLGQVLKANIVGDPGGCWKKFLRVRVDIPIEKPLLPGFFLPRPKKSDIWIGLKYEKVADICYKCGIIGHEEKSCEGNLFQLCNLKGTSFNAAGPWIRAGNDDYPPDAFACTEVPASASGSTNLRQYTHRQWQTVPY